jgi:uncharacterized protein
MAGNICHVEIRVTDMAAAKKFYAEVFGWTYPMLGDQYSLFATGAGVGGGLELDPKRQPDGAIRVYLGTDDIPATLAKIVAAGGKVELPKTEIGGGYGFMATFRDPSGNLLGLASRT